MLLLNRLCDKWAIDEMNSCTATARLSSSRFPFLSAKSNHWTATYTHTHTHVCFRTNTRAKTQVGSSSRTFGWRGSDTMNNLVIVALTEQLFLLHHPRKCVFVNAQEKKNECDEFVIVLTYYRTVERLPNVNSVCSTHMCRSRWCNLVSIVDDHWTIEIRLSKRWRQKQSMPVVLSLAFENVKIR